MMENHEVVAEGLPSHVAVPTRKLNLRLQVNGLVAILLSMYTGECKRLIEQIGRQAKARDLMNAVSGALMAAQMTPSASHPIPTVAPSITGANMYLAQSLVTEVHPLSSLRWSGWSGAAGVHWTADRYAAGCRSA